MPTIGERTRCKACGEEIEYIGPYWRHVGCNPRHIARPDRPERPTATEAIDSRDYHAHMRDIVADLRQQLATVTAERDEWERVADANATAWLKERNKLMTLLARCNMYSLPRDLHDLIDELLGED